MLTIEEASKLFKVSIPTIYRWIRKHSIPYKVELGKKYFDVDALQTVALRSKKSKI